MEREKCTLSNSSSFKFAARLLEAINQGWAIDRAYTDASGCHCADLSRRQSDIK